MSNCRVLPLYKVNRAVERPDETQIAKFSAPDSAPPCDRVSWNSALFGFDPSNNLSTCS